MQWLIKILFSDNCSPTFARTRKAENELHNYFEYNSVQQIHCVKSVQIRSFFWPVFGHFSHAVIFKCVSVYYLVFLLKYFSVLLTDNSWLQICSLVTLLKLAYYLKLLTSALFMKNIIHYLENIDNRVAIAKTWIKQTYNSDKSMGQDPYWATNHWNHCFIQSKSRTGIRRFCWTFLVASTWEIPH